MGLLDVPPEIRREIFTILFRSTTIRYPPCKNEHHLAILEVCRQIYREATPLALPNVRVWCERDAGLIDTLIQMGPEQVPQLRYLTVEHSPIGFKLCPSAEGLETDAATEDGEPQLEHEPDKDSDASSESNDFDGVRYFHLGAVLGLFPGLKLDLLEVFCGTGSTSYTGLQTTDCFGSLLEADGYRRLWMKAEGGDSDAWWDVPSTARWRDAIETRLKPHSGWKVRINVTRDYWDEVEEGREPWNLAMDAGITLVQIENEDEYNPPSPEENGHDYEGDADIVINRGDADFAVKVEDNRVLRCIERKSDGESPRFFKEASDALKMLFKRNSWEVIKAMDKFDDGTLDSWYEGDAIYEMRRFHLL